MSAQLKRPDAVSRVMIGPVLVRLHERLRARPDSEHEMSFNRLLFTLLFALFLTFAAHAPTQWAIGAVVAYGIFAITVLAHILVLPAPSNIRRAIALAADVAIVSWELHAGGETAAIGCSLYIWIAIGNGLRFGTRWLWVATAANLAGACWVFWSTRFWRDNVDLTLGIMIGLVMLPMYTGVLMQRLARARSEAEKANKAKSIFLASVSHELRTPLNAISGMADLLRETGLSFDQLEMAQTIQAGVGSLLGLINGVLDLSRIDIGKMPAEPVRFDIAELAREVLSLISAQARSKGLALALHIHPDTPLDVIGSRRHISEILLNLAANAVKFTESGSVTLSVEADYCDLETCRLRFVVADTGIGIAAEAQERIFESFTQADPTILNRFGGTGLGLSIASKLAGLVGGALSVRSALGQGSAFTLSLNLGLDAAGPRASARFSEHPAHRLPCFDRPRVVLLAADDSERDRWSAELSRLGARVEALARPDRAIWLLRGHRAPGQERCIFIASDKDMTWSIRKLAVELDRIDPLGSRADVLISDSEDSQSATISRSFVTVLPPACGGAALAAALRIAGARITESETAAEGAATTADPSPALDILVADDNPINQRIVNTLLTNAGHRVSFAHNGEQALDALDDPQRRFDLVLMDINMPELDGIEVTKLYRFMALGRRRIPIVALTADPSTEMMKRCIDAGMDGYVTKPIDAAHLLQVVGSLTLAEPEPQAPALIASISEHPRFKPSAAVLDESVVRSLRHSGGQAGDPAFVSRLVTAFLADARRRLADIAAAAASGDMAHFRNEAQALWSGASDIGARSMATLCASWQALSDGAIAAQKTQIAAAAQAELDRTIRAFRTLNLLAEQEDAGH